MEETVPLDDPGRGLAAERPLEPDDAGLPLRATSLSMPAQADKAVPTPDMPPGVAMWPPSETVETDGSTALTDALQPEERAAAVASDSSGANAPDSTRRVQRPRFRDRPQRWWLQALMGESPAVRRPTASSTTVPQSVLWTRSGRGLIAGAVGLVLLGLIIGRLLGGSTAALAPQPTPTATVTPIPFAPIPGAVVAVAETRGESAGLGGPLDVAALPDGHVAVADTANGRLVILNAAGHIVGNPKPGEGGLRQPYAVVYSAGGLDVLDAEADAIMRFDSGGRFVGVVLHDSALHLARGMNVGPDGRLYVANPLTNSILVISPHGKIQSQIHTPNGKAPGEFDQVSDVAVGADGTIYALDNQNNRIEALSASGSYLAQWPAPPSSTLASVHILPLSGGRLLATDPSGALLAYQPGGGSPTRSSLTLNGQVLTSVEPLGLVMTAHGRLLVADGHGNRVLVVTLPPALR